MPTTSQLIQQIIEIKSRLLANHHYAELMVRLKELEASFQNRNREDREALRYYPIALVACIESFFRLAIQNLIDSKQDCLENAAKLASKIKFDYEMVKALRGQKVSIGDIISHQLSINNLGQIAAYLDELLQTRFLEKIAIVHDPWDLIRGIPPSPIINDPNRTFNSVGKIFELRHIYCHEFASEFEAAEDDVAQYFNDSVLFMKASALFINEVLYPGAPLTQADMNAQAAEDFAAKEAELNQKIEKLTSLLNEHDLEIFTKMQAAWVEYRRLSTEFEGNKYEGGTIRPTVELSKMADLTSDRIHEIEKMVRSAEND